MSRRFPFSLRALLILTTAAICAWLGWHFRAANRQKDAVAQIQQMGGCVDFDEDGVTPFEVTFLQPDVIRNADGTVTRPVEWRDRIYTVGAQVMLTDDGLKYVSSLSDVQLVWISGVPITDAGLRRLRGLKKLVRVRLFHTNVTPAGVAELQKALPTCEIELYPATTKARTAMSSK
jgi:hypothetical protein